MLKKRLPPFLLYYCFRTGRTLKAEQKKRGKRGKGGEKKTRKKVHDHRVKKL
jgi:hypothetical protein